MAKTRVLFRVALMFSVVLTLLNCHAAEEAALKTEVILPVGAAMEKRVTPTSGQVVVAESKTPASPGVTVTINPGEEGYPGVRIKPEGTAWNLSRFGHVEARVVNTGTRPLTIALRVDNAGNWQDNPWNTESITLPPGQADAVTTIFGYAYGHKPGYALKPSAIVGMMLFTSKSDQPQSFRIVSLTAGGTAGEKPPVAPEDVRIKPKDGLLLGIGVTAASERHDGQQITFSPPEGRWDLRDYLEVQVRIRNVGKTPVTPRVRLDSNGGPSDWQTGSVLAPGRTEDVAVPFTGNTPIDLSQKDKGNRITSDAVSAVVVAPQDAAGDQPATGEPILHIESIRAALPQTTPPAWLGKRPPVAGDWVKTLDDEFSGKTLDQSVWSIYGENYWDKQTHWSKDDVLLGGGLVRLRYEKKTGPNNDDLKQKQSAYAAGYLHTYDKWTQCYGYFEARMKLPSAPGLWPAFWMMPDRGGKDDPQWKRQDTANGGMEFDIMEHLDRWGPYRYNIAMHYDGYGKDHKSVGSDRIYVQPDKEGFITCGLLWTPGEAIYYCNGREVLRWQNPRISDVPEILMFTLPMGGWDNDPLDDARLPDTFTIDYVRVWQRRDLK